MATASDTSLRGRQEVLGQRLALGAAFLPDQKSRAPELDKPQLHAALSQLFSQLETGLTAATALPQSKTRAQQALHGSAELHVFDDPGVCLQHLFDNPNIQPKTMQALKEFVELFTSKKVELHVDFKPHAAELCKGVLQEIAFPEKINQHDIGTCASTTVQMALAVENPTKYLKLMKSLVSTSGGINLASGAYLGRTKEDTTGKKTVADDGSGRSLSSRLMQNAFAQFAKAAPVYQKSEEMRAIGRESLGSGGLLAGESLHLLQAVTGAKKLCLIGPAPTLPPSTDFEVLQRFQTKKLAREVVFAPMGNACQQVPSTQDLLQAVRAQTESGSLVPVGLELGAGGHSVLVTRVDAEQMYFMNPWGVLHKMPLEAACLCLNEAFITVPQAAQEPTASPRVLEAAGSRTGAAQSSRLTGAIADPSRYQDFELHRLPPQKVGEFGTRQLARALEASSIVLPADIPVSDNPMTFIAKINDLSLQKKYIQEVIPLLQTHVASSLKLLKELNISYLKAMLSAAQ